MNKRKTIFLLFAAMVFVSSSPAFAQTIDPWWAWGENVGWFNLEPSLGPGVTVTRKAVTGYIWQENVGWINLGPLAYGGVVNDRNGNLSGYAWGENVGWISFSCVNTNSCAAVDYKVTIDAQDNFTGWAWGENIGWIAFSPEVSAADSDGDGYPDAEDNCPYKPNGYELGSCSPWSGSLGVVCESDNDCSASCTGVQACNKNQEDTDSDGVGDVCDNCPNNCNSLQKDADGDGIGDVCDSTPGCGGCSGIACEQQC